MKERKRVPFMKHRA